MPQTGPDLVGAGYPISLPLTALLGGSSNIATPNVPIKTNWSYTIGPLTDVAIGSVQAGNGSVFSMPVPVSPGDVITRISLLTGGTASTPSGSVTNLWAALYTGTGSAPGTTGAQPTLIASGPPGSVGNGGAGSVGIGLGTRFDFTLSSPVTITSVQAPYGFIYASYSLTTPAGSPAASSLLSLTCASIAMYQWYSTSPFSLCFTSNAAAGSAVPLTLGTATRFVNPPVVLLS